MIVILEPSDSIEVIILQCKSFNGSDFITIHYDLSRDLPMQKIVIPEFQSSTGTKASIDRT